MYPFVFAKANGLLKPFNKLCFRLCFCVLYVVVWSIILAYGPPFAAQWHGISVLTVYVILACSLVVDVLYGCIGLQYLDSYYDLGQCRGQIMYN